ncbi:MAG: isopenicillin N synthase family oxygenase [Caulobacterales bacterium]|nr:isopenicillin N synthase family oxygenase [Caulobacterales bacterium]
MTTGVPTLSLSDYTAGDEAARARFAGELMRGFQRYGFIILRDHPVSAALLDRAYDLSTAFFSQPDEVKRRYVGGQRGYTPFGVEHAKDHAAPDLKEFWQIGPERPAGRDYGDIAPPNIWPEEPAGFRDTFTALFDALQGTGRIILEALTPGLDLPRDFFAPRVADGNSVLRLLHYPPVAADADPNCVRAAAHEDINFITILVAASASGLELLDRDGRWLPVETDKGNLIVDAGDMLARMTNDVIPATTHRVVNPAGPNVSRYSMPFFMHPNSDMVLSCLPSCVGTGAKYADITAGAFLEQRLKEIGLIEADA